MCVTLLLFVLRYAKLIRMTLSDYIKTQGRGGLTSLARTIGAHAPDLSRWAAGERPVPIERCVAIEAATGGAVSRIDLKPNDWQLIWPELTPKQKEVA